MLNRVNPMSIRHLHGSKNNYSDGKPNSGVGEYVEQFLR